MRSGRKRSTSIRRTRWIYRLGKGSGGGAGVCGEHRDAFPTPRAERATSSPPGISGSGAGFEIVHLGHKTKKAATDGDSLFRLLLISKWSSVSCERCVRLFGNTVLLFPITDRRPNCVFSKHRAVNLYRRQGEFLHNIRIGDGERL